MKTTKNGAERGTKKLRLASETLRRLTAGELEVAVGGATVICTEFCQSKSLCHC